MPTKASTPTAMMMVSVRGENTSLARRASICSAWFMLPASRFHQLRLAADQPEVVGASAVDLLVGVLAAEAADLDRAHQHFERAAVAGAELGAARDLAAGHGFGPVDAELPPQGFE